MRRYYVGTVEEIQVQRNVKGHEMKGAIVQWWDRDDDDDDDERPLYPEARLRVRPRGREQQFHG